MTTEIPADSAERVSAWQAEFSFAVLDQALWTQFSNAGSVGEFVQSWLALLCRNLEGVAEGLVILGDPETGPFPPIAFWPERSAVGSHLTAVANQAVSRRQPVLAKYGRSRDIALPVLVDDALYGAVAVSVEHGGTAPGDVLRQLRWGLGWIEVLLRRDEIRGHRRLQERTAVALDMLANIIEQKRFRAACSALVTELAIRLGCDPVSIGFLRGGRVRMAAVSHAATFGSRLSMIRDIGAAMDEAVDQRAVVLYPPNPDWDYRVTLAHEELARVHKMDWVLTVPIQHDGEIVGALTLERAGDAPFDEATVELCDAIATIIGPVLDEKRRNDRSVIVKLAESIRNQFVRLLGPSYFGRKLATVMFALAVLYFVTAKGDFEIAAPAVLEGTIQRTVVAPFAGYLASENVRAGGIVKKGDLLATLDDQDLRLERLRLSTERAQRVTEYDQALANRERAKANIMQSQIEQADSQIALIDEQLARTRITAPFDGIVVSGDLSQSVGATVERGEELFRIAPLHAYRVILEIDEGDIAEIEQGQTGKLRVASLPDEALAYTIERITPIADQREGRNFFRVEARLHEVNERLRPSMEGIARTEIEERLLISIWTRRLVDWLRLAAWRWTP